MKEKIVLIGAGSSMFTRGILIDLIKQNDEIELALVDIDQDTLSFIESLSLKIIETSKAPIKLTATLDRRTVLKGATIVICTIGVGGRRAWEQDVFIPRKYDIFQPVGDTAGAGGSSRALRMIPAMVAIAKDVIDLAPNALFINYGNPMAPICRAVRKATGANMYGLCHGVNETLNYLSFELGVDNSRMKFSYAGINHLTWVTEARIDGEDAFPRLKEIAKQKIGMISTKFDLVGLSFTDTKDFKPESKFSSTSDLIPFSWELFLKFGAFPAPMDRHVTEFFPQFYVTKKGNYYGKQLGIDAYSFEDCIEFGDKIYDEMREIATSPKPLPIEYFKKWGGEQEQAVEIFHSIRNDLGKVFSANLPNKGQIPNLPEDSIIESPVVAGASGLRPIMQPALPSGVAGTLATRMQWVETIVEASLEGSREKFIQALIIDGTVSDFETAEKLADALLTEHAQYLPQFDLKSDRVWSKS